MSFLWFLVIWVWYNFPNLITSIIFAVVPSYYLVWYNREHKTPHNTGIMRGFSI